MARPNRRQFSVLLYPPDQKKLALVIRKIGCGNQNELFRILIREKYDEVIK